MKSKCVKLLLIAIVGLGTAGTPVCMQILASSGDLAKERGVDSAGFTYSRIICSGRVEAIKGEIEVVAQIAGGLAEVRVREGDFVEQGAILAVLDGARQMADLSIALKNVQLAQARLERLMAGNGEEEVAQARAAAEAVKAELSCEEKSLARARRLIDSRAVSRDDFDHRSERVEQLKHQLESLQKHYEALRRGPLAGEIEIARAELNLAEARLARARVEHEFRFVRAPISGTILKLYRQTGDSVPTNELTFAPILRMADTQDLRVRLEIDEAHVPLVQPGIEGAIEVRGVCGKVGRLKVETIVPTFGPKRLFNPDTSAQHDARTLTVLCQVQESSVPLYPGQRVTAHLQLNGSTPSDRAVPAPVASGNAGRAPPQPRG